VKVYWFVDNGIKQEDELETVPISPLSFPQAYILRKC
jgi:hypothetical protein